MTAMRTKHTFRLPPDLAGKLADYAARKRVPQALVVGLDVTGQIFRHVDLEVEVVALSREGRPIARGRQLVQRNRGPRGDQRRPQRRQIDPSGELDP